MKSEVFYTRECFLKKVSELMDLGVSFDSYDSYDYDVDCICYVVDWEE